MHSEKSGDHAQPENEHSFIHEELELSCIIEKDTSQDNNSASMMPRVDHKDTIKILDQNVSVDAEALRKDLDQIILSQLSARQDSESILSS